MAMTHYMPVFWSPICGKNEQYAMEDRDWGTDRLDDPAMKITCPECLQTPEVKSHWRYIEDKIKEQLGG